MSRSQRSRIERIDLRKKVLYRFAITMLNNELLIKTDPRIRARDSARRDGGYRCYARLWEERCANNNGYVYNIVGPTFGTLPLATPRQPTFDACVWARAALPVDSLSSVCLFNSASIANVAKPHGTFLFSAQPAPSNLTIILTGGILTCSSLHAMNISKYSPSSFLLMNEERKNALEHL